MKRLFLILTIVATSLYLKAQNLPELKVASIYANGIINFPDTINGGIIYAYQITVVNTDTSITYINDTAALSGLFTIEARLADTSLAAFSLFSTNASFQILPGDSITFQTTDSFPAGLKPGNNVVVVWPSKVGAGFNPFTIDSTFFNIYYIAFNNIENIELAGLRIYPNPFVDYIAVNGLNDERYQIFVFNATGQIVYQSPLTKQFYDLSFLKQGAYLIEFRKSQKVVVRKKLIKL